jgi:hypothetical protein
MRLVWSLSDARSTHENKMSLTCGRCPGRRLPYYGAPSHSSKKVCQEMKFSTLDQNEYRVLLICLSFAQLLQTMPSKIQVSYS